MLKGYLITPKPNRIHKVFFWVRIGQVFYFNGLKLVKVGNLKATDTKTGLILDFVHDEDVIVEE